MRRERSKQLHEKAVQLIPGGVNSPVRAFKSVGGDPLFLARGDGPYVYDVDGNRYIDYVCSWGPLILGHAPKNVVEAVVKTAAEGTSFGAATQREVELAERVVRAVPSVERVRFVNSGTEATMSALRLARGFRKRDKVIKFAGCYHGHADAFLSESGSGVATLGIPGSSGVPEDAAKNTITVPYNSLEAVDAVLKDVGDEVAAIIVEPIACNMGLVLPRDGFLSGLRSRCDEFGALLIFDEVITGFRVAPGGAQENFDVRPDLSTFGKVIGGGLPVGAYGGRADIMKEIAPEGSVYQAGTLSGNPLAMAAGIATLDALLQPGFFDRLEESGAYFEEQLQPVLNKHGRPARLIRFGSIFYLWFKAGSDAPPRNYEEIKTAQGEKFCSLFGALLNQGVSIAPSPFEVGFISSAHQHEHLDATVTAIDKALTSVSN